MNNYKELRMNLADKLRKNSKIDLTGTLSTSKVYSEKDLITTPVPMLNVAFSGSVYGGFTPGVTIFAGPSKHFKTLFCLIAAKSYLDKYPDAVLLFYDSEFGSPKSYFESVGIDPDRVITSPITDIEQLKNDMVNQIKGLDKTDKVFMLIDSLGNLASVKELEDTEAGKVTVDMTRAKSLKSFFRMVTPHLTLKDIPLFIVSHTYDTIEMFSKKVVSGGVGQYYAADNIYILGRQQEKEGKDVVGYNFIINVEKSRYVVEKTKIPIKVTHTGGVDRYSGLFEVAMAGGYIVSPTQGWYELQNPDTGEIISDGKVRRKDITGPIFEQLLSETSFSEFIEKHYKVSSNRLISDEPIEEEVEE